MCHRLLLCVHCRPVHASPRDLMRGICSKLLEQGGKVTAFVAHEVNHLWHTRLLMLQLDVHRGSFSHLICDLPPPCRVFSACGRTPTANRYT
jgi:hypothetical protein